MRGSEQPGSRGAGTFPGATLPPSLAARLASGRWIRTGHRGAPRVAPGNTARALQAATDLGVDLVEVDVRVTADGQLALWHDPAVRLGTRRLDVADSNLSELQAAVRETLDEDLIDLCTAASALAGRSGLLVDLKVPGLAGPVVEALASVGFENAVVCGEYADDLRMVKRRSPRLGASLTLGHGWRERAGEPTVEAIDFDAVTIAWSHVNAGIVARLHARGIAVLVWTVDRPALMRRLLRLGVDGLTSNRPDLLMSLDEDHG